MFTLKQFMVPAENFVKVDCGVHVQDAVKIMDEHGVGSVFVTRNDSIVGILSDTEVVRRVIATGMEPTQSTVEHIMSSPIPMIEENQTLQDANDLMAREQVRHLGISNAGNLVGMVSVRDVVVGMTSGPSSVLPPSWVHYQKGAGAYERGDYITAAKTFEELAGQGLARAQYQLGTMYQHGQGVPQNDVQAFMWVILSAMAGFESAVAIQKDLMQRMPPDQIIKAERLAKNWQVQGK